MSKIKFKLKSVCTTYVKDTNGKLYKLKPGLNTLELEHDDYVSLATALGIRVKHNANSVAKESSDSSKLNEKLVDTPEQLSTNKDTVDNTAADIVDDTDKDTVDNAVADIVDDVVDDIVEDIVDDTVKNDTADEVDTDANDEVVDDLDSSATIDYSSWSYNKLKAEYKKITGTNCRLKKGDVIAFLQEHRNV